MPIVALLILSTLSKEDTNAELYFVSTKFSTPLTRITLPWETLVVKALLIVFPFKSKVIFAPTGTKILPQFKSLSPCAKFAVPKEVVYVESLCAIQLLPKDTITFAPELSIEYFTASFHFVAIWEQLPVRV